MAGAAVESKFVEVNGQKLHYRQWSAEGPPLIFLHGVTSSITSWDTIAPSFTDDYAVIAFDLRGHGLSSKPEKGYAWAEDYATDFVAYLKEHVDQPAILIGHSLGAMLTPPIAVGAQDRVRAIIMEDPPAFRPSENKNATHERFAPVLDAMRLPYEQRVQLFMEQMNNNRPAAIVRADNLENLSEQVLLETLAGTPPYRPDDWFPKVACPSLIILGNPERGAVVDHKDRPRLPKLLSNTTIVEWDDVGHGIHAEQPGRYISEVKAFLQSLS